MSSARALRLAVLLLFAGGVVFAVVGWRVLDLESAERARRVSRDANLVVARGKADAELLARTPRGKPLARWRLEPLELAPARAEAADESSWSRLRAAAAAEGDPTAALARYEALLHPELPTWVQDIAALRSAVLLNGLQRFEASRRRLARAAQASPLLNGLERRRVRSTALRFLALDAAPRGDPGPLRRLLDEAEDGGRLVAGDVVGPGRAVLQLAHDLERTPWWRPEDPDVRRLARARDRAREGLRVLAAAPEAGMRLWEGRLAWRDAGQLAIFPLEALMQPVQPRTERGHDLVVLEPGAEPPPRALRLEAPLERVAVVPRGGPGGDGAGDRWLVIALGIGLLAYTVGAVAALAGWRRSVRAARQQAHFTAAVSHEMKTPIAAARAMAELLSTAPDGDASRTRTYGERIDREMQRLGATVRNVLDAAQIERGTFRVHAAPGDPRALLERVVEAFRPAVAARGFEVTLEAAAPAGPVPLDEAALEGVLRNLLENAVKFSGEARRIEVTGEPRPGGGYVIRVMDRGVGFGSGNPQELFGRYNRGTAAREGAVPGVGLGLHIAREVVVAHGGSLRARPRPRGGAVFEIELPGGHAA